MSHGADYCYKCGKDLFPLHDPECQCRKPKTPAPAKPRRWWLYEIEISDGQFRKVAFDGVATQLKASSVEVVEASRLREAEALIADLETKLYLAENECVDCSWTSESRGAIADYRRKQESR